VDAGRRDTQRPGARVLSPRGAHPGTGDEARAIEVRDDKHQDHDEERPSHDLPSGIATRVRKRPSDRESDERADGELTVLDQKADERRPNALKHFALRSVRPPGRAFSASAPRANSRPGT